MFGLFAKSICEINQDRGVLLLLFQQRRAEELTDRLGGMLVQRCDEKQCGVSYGEAGHSGGEDTLDKLVPVHPNCYIRFSG